MIRTVVLYGVALAALIAMLKYFEYQYIVRDLSVEIYIGVTALFFTGLGIWAGLKLTRKKVIIANPDFQFDEKIVQELGISKREQEVLEWMAQGLSNQEIADKLFVSPNTIKTHASNLFLKLDVSRRTQAIQKGKMLRIIP